MYKLNRTEKWIQEAYIKHSIYNPNDLGFDDLSEVFNVMVFRFPISARYDIFDGQNFIVVDSRVNIQQQREQFFHEVCHVLFHSGHQSNMPELFRQLLEWEADNFVLYAALPYHMIKHYDLATETIIYDLANDFNVSEKLCQIRMEQIRNRLYNDTCLTAGQMYVYN